MRAQIQAELDTLEDDAFFSEMPEQRDRRQKFVVRLRYRGRTPENFNIDWVELIFLEEGLEMRKEEGYVKAVITPPGIPEIDICFWTEGGLSFLLAVLLGSGGDGGGASARRHRADPALPGETKVVTISFCTAEIPLEDVTYWLGQRCRVLMGTQHTYDKNGYRNGGSRAIVALEHDSGSGWIHHLPKYLFMGADCGVVRYAGQPPACYTRGGYDHIQVHCNTELCSKCGVRGHRTATCRRLPTCSLCHQVGHTYIFCPQSETNKRDPDAFARDKQCMREAVEWRRQAE